MCVSTYVFVTLSLLQSQFIEKSFKKTENFEYDVVLLWFLFSLLDYSFLDFVLKWPASSMSKWESMLVFVWHIIQQQKYILPTKKHKEHVQVLVH